MELIKNTGEIQALITKVKGKNQGFITNFYLSASKQEIYIQDNLLTYISTSMTEFILFKIHDYYKLYYISTSYNDLKHDLDELTLPKDIIVCELFGKGGLHQERMAIQNYGFKEYGKLINYTKINKKLREPKLLYDNILYAEINDLDEILNIMSESFNKYIDLNMTVNEIKLNIVEKNVIKILDDNNNIAGFAIFSITTGSAFPIITAVKNKYKDTNIGFYLFMALNELYQNSKKISVYVRDDNSYLKEYYKKMKYIESGIESIICIKNNSNKEIEILKPIN